MRKFYFAVVMSLAALVVACDTPVNPTPEPKPEPTPDAPRLTLTSEPMLIFKAEGGSETICYTLENPVEGEYLDVLTSANWVVVVNRNTEGEIAIMVDENLSQSEREATVTVEYADDSFEVKVMQAAAESDTVVVEANTLSGTYYAEFLAEGLGNYWVVLSRDGFNADGSFNVNSSFYRLDVFGDLATDANNNIPDGTYFYDATGSGTKFSLNAGNSTLMEIDADGNVTERYYDKAVLKVQGHKLTLEAEVEGAKHVVTFNQEYQLPVRRPTDQISTLKTDIVMDVEGYAMRCESYGDYWHCGGCNWFVELVPEEQVNTLVISDGINLILDINTVHKDASGGFLGYYTAGGYVDGNKYEPNVVPGKFVSGVRVSAEGHLTGSLYMEYADNRVINQAPLVEGTVEITENGRGVYTLAVEAWDDAAEPNKITINWSGEPYFAQ